ncbi:MAG: 16S rRNA (cytidine(1402)-2'-O)-methyltransferase [Firmicutes bacterium]|nr:16S rRNA (cytidine(1402)-2'-O)-methyltransferase [Bacillota bacterium]
MAGILYLVATPIGNLEDITNRAVRVLGEVDLIAAEDTRNSRRLLTHFGITKPLVSYYEHNKKLRESKLVEELLAGKSVAVVSDAGTPALSDPGADIARAAIANGIEVVAIPGASALLAGLTVSGLDTSSFIFCGFAPRSGGERLRYLEGLRDEKRTMVFYEAPHRIAALLLAMAEVFGPEREACACRELTKLYEEKVRGSLSEIIAHFREHEPRGEFTLIVAGAPDGEPPSISNDELLLKLSGLLERGLSRRQAAKTLAKEYGLKASDVYDVGLDID